MTYNIDSRPKRNWRRWLLIGSLLLVLVLAGAAFLVRQSYLDNLDPVSRSEQVQLVTVPTGSTVAEIARDLRDRNLIKSQWAFEWYIRSQEVSGLIKAGTYALKPSQSIPEIVEVLTQGQIATDLVTILPGKRIDEIRQTLINYGFDPTEVDEALDPSRYEGHPALTDKPRQANLEGYIYPESFQKTAETHPSDIIAASLDEMQKRLTPEIRAGIVRQGLTVHEGVILASIIEREVRTPEERRQAAQVFLRRLKEGIKLESDATASYGAVLAGEEPSLSYDSAYNTYLHTGLPPTPISNSTEVSIEAVADPAKTDYLYFVCLLTNDERVTYFSRTLEEHEARFADRRGDLCE